MDKEATKESTLYLRLVFLFISVATKIVRSVFMHYAVQTIKAAGETSEDAHQTSEKALQSNEDARQKTEDAHETNKYVKAFLSSHETRRQLDELHRKNILSDKQYNMLTIETPRVEDFDISLLIILLCSLFKKNMELPEKGWGNKNPAPTDLTLGADLIRLRNYRNKIVGHSARARIFDHLFNDYWKDLETIFIRICKKICPSEESNIKEEVRTYKTMNIDQQTEKRCRVAIQDLRENCKDIVELQEQVEKLISETNEFLKFFKERPERYSRYIRLLFDGGQLVLSALLQRECSRSEKNINVLLQQNMEAIRENLGDEVKLQSLSETDPEKWDILHIATILLLLFKDTLKSTEIERIKGLLSARLDYSKIAVESLDETSFNKRYSELEKNLLVLSLDLGEKLQNECIKCIDDNSVANERILEEEYFGLLQKHSLNIRKLSDVYKDTLNQLKDAMKKMEDEDIGFKTEAVIQLKMITLGTEQQKRKLAEQTVETVWRAALEGAENSDRFDVVRQAAEKILGEVRKYDIRAADIQTKCIVLSLICPSPRSVLELLEYIDSTSFQDLCFLMSYELCDIHEDALAVSASLTIESLYSVLKNTMGDRDDASTSKDLTFTLSFVSVKGIRQLLDFVEAESTICILRTIAKELSEQVDDNISVKLEVDLQYLSAIFSRPEEICGGVLMEKHGTSDVSGKTLQINTRQLSSEHCGKRKDKGEVGGISIRKKRRVFGHSLQTASVQPSTSEAEVLLIQENEEETCGGELIKKHDAADVSVKPLPIDPRHLSSKNRGKRKDNGVVGGIDSSVLGPSLQAAPVQPSIFEEEALSEEENEDSVDWETCIKQLSEGQIIEAEKIAACQYKSERLPNQRQLNRLQQMRETSHSIVSEVSKRICSTIQSQSEHISNVWPAYKVGQRGRVIFVVETNETHVLKLDIPYHKVVFSADYFSENRKVAMKEGNSDKELSQSETVPLVEFIKKNAAELFKKHRYLSYVKPSLLRQEDSNRDEHIPGNLKKQCLAFYVRRKDYIPLDEEPFESYYEEFPAVVREGAFSLQTGTKIGCGITCFQDNNRKYPVEGTLGGFVEHPYYGLCGLTSAHVLLNAEEMKQLKQRRVISAPEKPTGILVCSVGGSQIGRIVKVVYEDGSNGPSGMEIALFQIETDQPKTAEFEGCNEENFIKGRAYGDTRLCNGVHVYKLGANMTKGEIIGIRAMTVKTHQEFEALLYSQIEVKPLHSGPFSEDGDSGSLVFIKEDGEYICIGMIVGRTLGVTSVVSPIVPVLYELNVTAFKSFVTDSLEERLSGLNSSMQKMEASISSVKNNMESMKAEILNRLERR